MSGREVGLRDTFGESPVRTKGIAASGDQVRPVGGLTKRGFDVVVALSALALLLPLFLILAGAIRLSSKEAIFFKQQRRGFRNRAFNCWKFRSMVPDAEVRLTSYLTANPEAAEEWRQTQKLKNDPRITQVGNFLRSTSLDELPQLWNVVCGDMSLVGPRPVVNTEIARYGGKFRYYAASRPGLTGLWQVSGRSQTCYDERIGYDVDYVTIWSLRRDLAIIFKTIPAVLSRRGSY